jgi:hypothetical protein
MADEMITVLPIAGFATVAHPSGVGIIVIKHLPGDPPEGATQEQIDRATVSLQYGIRAEQCAQLAQALFELADKLRAAKAALN